MSGVLAQGQRERDRERRELGVMEEDASGDEGGV